MSLTRRTFLGATAASLATIACGGDTKERRGQKKEAKNIIFCVADGMAVSVPTMVDYYAQLSDGRHSYYADLMAQAYATNGLQATRSLSSVVTDSAAAAAAWGSGRRQWNGQLNMFPDGTKLRPLTDIVQEQGMRTGLVTTTTITHATPSGFSVSIDTRNDQPGIALLHLGGGVDVLMGGGDPYFASRSDKRDLYAEFAKNGYTVVKDRDATLGLKANKILGIYNGSNLPYTIDSDNDKEISSRVPTLAEMSQVALNNLEGGSEGFLLQIEGGRVDHAAHGMDLAGMFYDQIAFEDAVKVAVDFALEDGETLVIITSDHACGGPGLNGADGSFGGNYFDSTAGLLTLQDMKASYDVIIPMLRKDPTTSVVQDIVEDRLGIKLDKDEADAVVASIGGKHPLGISEFHRSVNATLASVLGNHSKVNWTSGNHTAEHVLVTAVGPGSEQFGGLTENYRFFDLMLGMRGIEFSNPTMTYETAVKHIRSLEEKLTAQNLPGLEEQHSEYFLA